MRSAKVQRIHTTNATLALSLYAPRAEQPANVPELFTNKHSSIYRTLSGIILQQPRQAFIP